MIGSMTPFRISFAGGGSDLKAFYSTNPGCVVSTAIKKYMYLFVHPSFDEMTQVKYSQTELVAEIDQIRHPIVRETLRMFDLNSVAISSIADIPAGTGLGSSSSFTVGLLHALYAYIGKQVTAEQLAREACRLEIDILREPIGRQDQYAAAYGGLNLISFHADDAVTVEPIHMPPAAYAALEENLLMFFTGSVRDAGGILRDQMRNTANPRESRNLVRMTDLTRQLRDSLVSGAIDDMGLILDENWQLKKGLSAKVSSSPIDEFYELAKRNGALGGKLLGAGGGGFFLVYCRKEEQERLRRALPLREMEFALEPHGTRIILNSD